MKSLKPRDGGGDPPTGGGRNAGVSFRGEKRSNDTHVSTSDPDAMLYRKGPGMEARLCFIGHALMENQHGLFVDARLTGVSGHAERLAFIDQRRADAVLNAAGRADLLLEEGDAEGAEVWRRILKAIEGLQRGRHKEAGGWLRPVYFL